MIETASHSVEALYLNHHRWLVGWLRRHLQGADHAADLAQDIFVRLLHNPHMVNGILEPRAWLTTIARRLLIDKLRRERLERAYQEALLHLPEVEIPAPEVQLQLLQTLETIDALLAGLGDNVRMAFLLSRLDGLTYPEIAEQLNVSVSSVEKYMAKAIRHSFLLQLEWRRDGGIAGATG